MTSACRVYRGQKPKLPGHLRIPLDQERDRNNEDAYAYAKTLKMYYLSELPNPKPMQIIDPLDMRYPTLPYFDERWFEDVHAIFSLENAKPAATR